MKHFSLLYYVLSPLVRVLIFIFYRKYTIVGLENVPKDKPIILAPNHQNAFMDPVVVALSLHGRQTYFLVRADVFKKKLVSKLLHAIKMMPVYRIRDGVDSMDKNEDTFRKCYQILKDKKVVMLFPEGNHGNKKQLRSLKKGAGRIAFGAEEANNFSLDVHVVPVAINYSNFTNVGATLQVVFSKPILLSAFKNEYLKDPNKALVSFKNALADGMKADMADWSDELYTFIENVRKIFEFELSQGSFHQDIELANTKKLYSILEPHTNLVNGSIIEKSNRYLELLKLKGLKPFAVWFQPHSKIDQLLSYFVLLVTSPIWLFGLLNNFLPFVLPSLVVPKLIKDNHFHSSFKLAMMLLAFPLFYVLQFLLVYSFTNFYWATLYIVTTPLIGFLSLRIWYFMKMTYYKTQFNRKFDTKAVKEALAIRAELKAFLEPYVNEI